MSSEWPFVPVEDVCELIVDCVNKTAPVVPYETQYRMIRTTNIRDGRVSLESCRFVEKETYEKWTRRARLQYGDVLLTREAPIGEVGFVDLPEGLFLGQRIMQYRANPKVLHPRFLHYVFQSPSLKHQFGSHEGSGSVVSHIRVGDCFKFKIPLPPPDVQDGIAELLGALDDRITLLRETNATLEAIAQALFKSWFVDFDPVHAKAEGRQPEGMDATTAALFPDSFEESELGLVPKGWRHVSLKEVTAIFDSKRVPLSGQERDKRKGTYPYYGAAALMDWVDGYLFDGVYLLLGEDGSVADTAGYPVTQYVWGKIWVNNHAHVLQGKAGVSTEHLMLTLQQTNISPYITGAVQAKLSQTNMWRIPFLRSRDEVAIAFGEAIAPLFNSVRHNHEQAQTLTQLRDTLLPRLISGQLRLPEAEALVAEAV
ncbi:restriction endonuclease subunit S [Stutzerimonas kunmingensis]|uniref:restriction endonuclease subunit S n=1 Tax=Stutzerimonas kunmingensis TaxID=1211807 RepID=UPI0028B1A28D|nr:restriction endonuclease subunit S [Stutzerimonas kunmingensis]